MNFVQRFFRSKCKSCSLFDCSPVDFQIICMNMYLIRDVCCVCVLLLLYHVSYCTGFVCVCTVHPSGEEERPHPIHYIRELVF